ncbi:MAG TPA: hypothetical protein VGH16_23410 [Candidatus Binatia bacterium]|jgi:hypothetical protein
MIKAIALALAIAAHAAIGFCASNEIRDFKVIKQTSNSVVFEIKYYYAGDRGDKAELTAWPLPPGYWGSTIVPLAAGEHAAQLTVTLGPKVSKEVTSESVELFFISGGGPPFYKQAFPFKKKWANTIKEEKRP